MKQQVLISTFPSYLENILGMTFLNSNFRYFKAVHVLGKIFKNII